MATQIKSIDQANTQFKKNLKSAASNVDKSHSALCWALLNAVDTQDLSQLDTMHALVADTWPTLVSRFNEYVLTTLEGVTCASGQYVDGGGAFALSEVATLATPWNTKARLARDKATPAPTDIRVDVKRVMNKLAKCAAGKSPSVKEMQGVNSQHIADILARAQADIEAVYSGTYGAVAVPADEVVAALPKLKAA